MILNGVHYPHYRCPSPPHIPPSSVVDMLDVVLLWVKLKLQFAYERPGEKREIREQALMMALRQFEEEMSICCLTAGHSLIVADLLCYSYQDANTISAKKQLNMENVFQKIKS